MIRDYWFFKTTIPIKITSWQFLMNFDQLVYQMNTSQICFKIPVYEFIIPCLPEMIYYFYIVWYIKTQIVSEDFTNSNYNRNKRNTKAGKRWSTFFFRHLAPACLWVLLIYRCSLSPQIRVIISPGSHP